MKPKAKQPKAKQPTGWRKIQRSCDLCNANAVWEHPEGGLRCGKCPCPESTPSTLLGP